MEITIEAPQERTENNTPMEPLASGKYAVTIEKAMLKQASTGTKYMFVGYKTEENRWVWDSLFLTEKSAWKVGNLFRATGMGVGETVSADNPASYLGKRLCIDVGIEESDKGEKRNYVKAYSPVGDVADTVAPEDENPF